MAQQAKNRPGPKPKTATSTRSLLTSALADKLAIPKFLAADIARKLPGYLGKTLLDALGAVSVTPKHE